MEKIPRKLKKKVGKIPVGEFCKGRAIGAKPKKVNGMFDHKIIVCPFWSETYCSFMNVHEFGFLAEKLKLCGINKVQDVLAAKARKGKPKIWTDGEGGKLEFLKDGGVNMVERNGNVILPKK